MISRKEWVKCVRNFLSNKNCDTDDSILSVGQQTFAQDFGQLLFITEISRNKLVLVYSQIFLDILSDDNFEKLFKLIGFFDGKQTKSLDEAKAVLCEKDLITNNLFINYFNKILLKDPKIKDRIDSLCEGTQRGDINQHLNNVINTIKAVLSEQIFPMSAIRAVDSVRQVAHIETISIDFIEKYYDGSEKEGCSTSCYNLLKNEANILLIAFRTYCPDTVDIIDKAIAEDSNLLTIEELHKFVSCMATFLESKYGTQIISIEDLDSNVEPSFEEDEEMFKKDISFKLQKNPALVPYDIRNIHTNIQTDLSRSIDDLTIIDSINRGSIYEFSKQFILKFIQIVQNDGLDTESLHTELFHYVNREIDDDGNSILHLIASNMARAHSIDKMQDYNFMALFVLMLGGSPNLENNAGFIPSKLAHIEDLSKEVGVKFDDSKNNQNNAHGYQTATNKIDKLASHIEHSISMMYSDAMIPFWVYSWCMLSKILKSACENLSSYFTKNIFSFLNKNECVHNELKIQEIEILNCIFETMEEKGQILYDPNNIDREINLWLGFIGCQVE